jgi:hypothetical protein
MKTDRLTDELLVVAMGFERILEGKPPPLDEARQRKALRTRKEIRDQVMAFLKTAERKPVDDLPDFDYEEVSQLLRRAGDEKRIAALYAAMPNRDREIGTAIIGTVTPIVELLRKVLPRQVRKTVAGVEVSPGSDTEEAKFARTWSVACDPLICLRDMREEALSDDMVKAWELCYPEMLKYAQSSVMGAVEQLSAKRPAWVESMTDDRTAQLLTLMQRPDAAPDLASDFQAMYSQMPKKGAPPASGRVGASKMPPSTIEGSRPGK